MTVNLRTTKIKSVTITEDFKQTFEIKSFQCDYKQIKNLYIALENETNIISTYFYSNKKSLYVITSKQQFSQSFINNYGLGKIENIDDLEKIVINNLLLRSVASINKNSLFSNTENLSYLYDFNQKNVSKDEKNKGWSYNEFYALDFTIENEDVLVFKSTSYTSYDDLYKYYMQTNNKIQLDKLKDRAIFFNNRGKIIKKRELIKDKKNKDERIKDKKEKKEKKYQEKKATLTKIVKKKIDSTSKKVLSAFNFFIEDKINKLEIFAKLEKELQALSKFFVLNFEEVKIEYIEKNHDEDNKRGKVIVSNHSLDFTNEHMLLSNCLNVIDETKSSYLALILLMLNNKGIKNVTCGQYDPNKVNIVISYDPEYYRQNKHKDPYSVYTQLNTQFINVEKKESEDIVDLISISNSNNVKKIKYLDLLVNKISTSLNECLIKKNIMDLKIEGFKKFSHDGLLIKLTIDNSNITDMKGVLNKNGHLSFLDQGMLLSDKELEKVVVKEIIPKISQNKKELILFSFGKATTNSIFFENIYCLERQKEVLLNDIITIAKNKETKSARRMFKDYNCFDGHGLFGIMLINKDKNEFDYAIGSTEYNPQSNVPRFPSFYKSYVLKEKNTKQRKEFFDFFEHYYIKLNNAVSVPYLAKYLDEYFQ